MILTSPERISVERRSVAWAIAGLCRVVFVARNADDWGAGSPHGPQRNAGTALPDCAIAREDGRKRPYGSIRATDCALLPVRRCLVLLRMQDQLLHAPVQD